MNRTLVYKTLLASWSALKAIPPDSLGHDPEHGWYYRDALVDNILDAIAEIEETLSPDEIQRNRDYSPFEPS